MTFFSRYRILIAALALVVGACSGSDSTAPEQRTDDQLNLLTVALNTPSLANPVVSFYAVKGKNSGTEIWYRPVLGLSDSTKLLEFKLGGATLDRRPDGTAIADGDSVRITVTVVDPIHLVVQFQPSGLRFSAKDPAKLRMFFGACGDDLDRNGIVNADDSNIALRLSIWRQELPGLPWVKLSSAVTSNEKRVDAQIDGFSGYALAY
jgi:hypothetical protein